MVTRTVSKDDWAAVALDAIAEGGLAAVAVEPLARRLGVTKGSFYWHFSGRDDLVAAAIARWEAMNVAPATSEPDPARAVEELVGISLRFAGRVTVHERLVLETADPRAAAALARVDEARVAGLAALYRRLGLPRGDARARAVVAYGAILGLRGLLREGRLGTASQKALERQLRAVLVP